MQWMCRIRYLIALLLLPLCVATTAYGQEKNDILRVVTEHIGDSYGWHITTVGEHEVTVPLPVIVRSPHSGWHCFPRSRLHGGARYEGFRLPPKGNMPAKSWSGSRTGQTCGRWIFR